MRKTFLNRQTLKTNLLKIFRNLDFIMTKSCGKGLSECNGKLKALWEALKSLDMPKKTLIEGNHILIFNKKTIKSFQRFLFEFSRISLN